MGETKAERISDSDRRRLAAGGTPAALPSGVGSGSVPAHSGTERTATIRPNVLSTPNATPATQGETVSGAAVKPNVLATQNAKLATPATPTTPTTPTTQPRTTEFPDDV